MKLSTINEAKSKTDSKSQVSLYAYMRTEGEDGPEWKLLDVYKQQVDSLAQLDKNMKLAGFHKNHEP